MFGGGEESTTQTGRSTTKKVYSPEARSALQREQEDLTDVRIPLETQLLRENLGRLNALPGTAIPGFGTTGRWMAPQAFGAFDPTDTYLRNLALQLQSGMPMELAEATPSIMPQQYLSLFTPESETTSTSEGGGGGGPSAGQTAMGAVATAASIAGTVAAIA